MYSTLSRWRTLPPRRTARPAPYGWGGIMPRSSALPRPERIRSAEAGYFIDGPFLEFMAATQQVGVDGCGGKLGKSPSLRCVGAGGSAILVHPTIPGLVMHRCMIYSKSPGRQTVCRAEAWALHNGHRPMAGQLPARDLRRCHLLLVGHGPPQTVKHLKGANADIWAVIYNILEHKKLRHITAKVKSHATSTEVRNFGHSVATLALNELADIAAGILTDHQGDWLTTIAEQEIADKRLEAICYRIAHVQASVWRDENRPRVFAAMIKAKAQARGLATRGDMLDSTALKIMLRD